MAKRIAILAVAATVVVGGLILRAQLANTSVTNGSGAPSGACVSGSSYIDSTSGFGWNCTSGSWKLMASSGVLSGTTAAIGGSLLVVGASASGTASVTGAAVGQPCLAVASDGTNMAALGASPICTVTASGTVTVNLVAIISLTPASKTYNVRVLP